MSETHIQSACCWDCGTVIRYRSHSPVEWRGGKRVPCATCTAVIRSMPERVGALQSPIQDQIDKIDSETFTIEAGTENGDAGARVEFNKTFSEAWQAGLLAEWFKDKGYKAMGYIRWRGRR